MQFNLLLILNVRLTYYFLNHYVIVFLKLCVICFKCIVLFAIKKLISLLVHLTTCVKWIFFFFNDNYRISWKTITAGINTKIPNLKYLINFKILRRNTYTIS